MLYQINFIQKQHFKQFRAKSGFETEFFLLNREGCIVNEADSVLKTTKDNAAMKKECSLNMIEIASMPSISVIESAKNWAKDSEALICACKKLNITLCPLGTYPGKNHLLMRREKRHNVEDRIIGAEKNKISGRCVGFHYHYSLPKGTFNSKKHILKTPKDKKSEKDLVGIYNFSIASDPAITCFMQSSPYYQGKNIGKDSRIIMWRDGKYINYSGALHFKHEYVGNLPEYCSSYSEILKTAYDRHSRWDKMIKKTDLSLSADTLYRSVLSPAWNAMKVNAHGTVEQRGMDMNHPFCVIAAGILIKSALERIQESSYKTKISTEGIKEPFKIEDNSVFLPPYDYLYNELQKISALDGLENKVLLDYCKRFLVFASKELPRELKPFVRVFGKMIEDRKTVSDEILEFCRSSKSISDELAAKIALKHSERFEKELNSASILLEKISL